ncbi:MAG: hypothetical protein AB1401_00985 [Thermodesulfobacteriota bacterium]
MRKIIFVIIGLILLYGAYVVYRTACTSNMDILDVGTFIVITLTLVALIIYANDTNLIASITRSRWERESILQAYYMMEVLTQDKSDKGRTMFRIGNPSSLILRAKVWCNFQLYGQSVGYHDDFNGKKTWYMFPQQVNQGWFEIAPLLDKKGKTMGQIIEEATDDNYREQLTMDLQIEFRDELGNQRKLPKRRHFFDFKEWQWIPQFTQRDDWIDKS